MRVVYMILAALVVATGTAQAKDGPLTDTITAMGGIPINVSAWGIAPEEFAKAVDDIATDIEYLESVISTYRPDSHVSRLNHGERPPTTPEPLLALTEWSLAISRETGGAFDITVKPLVQLWRQCRNEDRLPTEIENAAAVALVDYRQVSINYDGPSGLVEPVDIEECDGIQFGQPGMMLDFGGIAKGYFADIAIMLLKQAGARRCLVDCGGDITTWQETMDIEGEVRPFRVAIQDPRDKQMLLAVLSIPTGAVVTSGSYERFYEIDGKRYCHIFDPRTGWPVEGMLSVTLLADQGIDADALATAVFVMGAKAGLEYVELHPTLEAVIISEDAAGGIEIAVSSGLTDLLEFAPHS